MTLSTHYIRRMDRADGTHGWEVRFGRERVNKLFSDGSLGGPDAALAAAIAWRDSQPWYPVARRSAPHRLADDPDFVTAVLFTREMRRDEASSGALPSQEPQIRRVDAPGAGRLPGWMAAAFVSGHKAWRLFTDATWGDSELALCAARTWCDMHPQGEVRPRERLRRQSRRTIAWQPRERVLEAPTRIEKTQLGDGRKGRFAFWVTAWTDEHGLRWERKFSVNFWGEDVARQKAQAVHEHNLRQAQPATSPAGRSAA